jgi:hypothetical protein
MSWGRSLTLDRPISTREIVRLKGVHTADWKIEDCGWREHVERVEEELRKDAGHVRNFCPASLETTFGS